MKRPVTLAAINSFLRISGWGPSRLGLRAANDAKLIHQIRAGREITAKMGEAIATAIEEHVSDVQTQARKLKDLVK